MLELGILIGYFIHFCASKYHDNRRKDESECRQHRHNNERIHNTDRKSSKLRKTKSIEESTCLDLKTRLSVIDHFLIALYSMTIKSSKILSFNQSQDIEHFNNNDATTNNKQLSCLRVITNNFEIIKKERQLSQFGCNNQ